MGLSLEKYGNASLTTGCVTERSCQSALIGELAWQSSAIPSGASNPGHRVMDVNNAEEVVPQGALTEAP
jgi:hypothetical protein